MPTATPPRQLPLRCTKGTPAPPDLRDDLLAVAALPAAARDELWSVLGPSLAEPLTPGAEEALDAFLLRHDLERAQLAAAVKACRFLLRAAARSDASRADVAADVAELTASDPAIGELVMRRFDDAKAVLRRELVLASLADQGNLFSGVDWTLTRLVTSHRGDDLRADVAVLTFRYREGADERRLTLQLLPEHLVSLRAACNRLST